MFCFKLVFKIFNASHLIQPLFSRVQLHPFGSHPHVFICDSTPIPINLKNTCEVPFKGEQMVRKRKAGCLAKIWKPLENIQVA